MREDGAPGVLTRESETLKCSRAKLLRSCRSWTIKDLVRLRRSASSHGFVDGGARRERGAAVETEIHQQRSKQRDVDKMEDSPRNVVGSFSWKRPRKGARRWSWRSKVRRIMRA